MDREQMDSAIEVLWGFKKIREQAKRNLNSKELDDLDRITFGEMWPGFPDYEQGKSEMMGVIEPLSILADGTKLRKHTHKPKPKPRK